MATPDEMRAFALDCLRWAELTNNASHRDLMLNVAKTWMNTASWPKDDRMHAIPTAGRGLFWCRRIVLAKA